MIISIFASIGAQNLGDELILKNEIKLLEKKYSKDTKFLVFSYDQKNPFFKKSNIEYKEYFPVGIKNLRNIFRNIVNFFIFLSSVLKSDLIVIGGGGIIYDDEKQLTKNPLDQWLFRANLFRLLRKKVNFFSIGINIKNDKNLNKLKKIFSKANKVTVRDEYSFNLLKSVGIESQIVQDPVFNDGLQKNNKSFLLKKINSFNFGVSDLKNMNFDFFGKKIALALRQGYILEGRGKLNSKFEEGKINEIINYILKEGGEVVLLPHSFHKTDILANDYLFLSKFLRINEKIRIINSMEEVYSKYIYKEIDLCIAMRLHSIILSQVYSIPFIGISYSKKTDEILDYITSIKNK